jgi:hypothetical protein
MSEKNSVLVVEHAGMVEDVGSDGVTVQGAGSQDIGDGERTGPVTLPDLPPPSRLTTRSSFSGSFIMLMLVMSAIPRDEDCHDFADQRTLFFGT